MGCEGQVPCIDWQTKEDGCRSNWCYQVDNKWDMILAYSGDKKNCLEKKEW